MPTILSELTQQFHTAIQAAFPKATIAHHLVEVVVSTQEKFGQFQCNSAMKMAGLLEAKPRAIAEAIVAHLPQDKLIAKADVAGPGFINLTLSPAYLAEKTNAMLRSDRLAIDKISPPIRLVMDFSSPNAAKDMHVGHLRSTIIGDCLARLFEFLGYDVLRISHIGDWGTAFGMLIAHLKETYPAILAGTTSTDLAQLLGWYKESKQRFDADVDFKKRSQLEVVALQNGDPTSLKAWRIICDISSRGFKQIYDLLGVKLTERGESFYNPMLTSIVAALEQKGMVEVSEGAKCIFLEGFENRDGEKLPIIIQKSDGGFNYSTTDLAAIRHRVDDEAAQRIIYVTDSGQSLHFAMIFKAAEIAGFYDPHHVTLNHVGFGLVLGPDGKKFKTRSGDTERLMDLLTAAIDKAKQILIEREVAMDDKQLTHTAITLGINAIKYADLSSNRISDYVFSYDRMLRFEGNTAAFLMYSYVRINGIKRKVGKTQDQLQQVSIALHHPTEIALALHLNLFADMLEAMAIDLMPNRLAEYLYNLAEKFNAFFRDCRVEGDPAQDSRLLLCEVTARVLSQGMQILGLKVIDKM